VSGDRGAAVTCLTLEGGKRENHSAIDREKKRGERVIFIVITPEGERRRNARNTAIFSKAKKKKAVFRHPKKGVLFYN